MFFQYLLLKVIIILNFSYIVFKKEVIKININIKLLNSTAKVPTKGSDFAAGFDLYVNEKNDLIHIFPHETIKIKTGVAIAIPNGYFGGIYARSGLAAKQGLRPANCVGMYN